MEKKEYQTLLAEAEVLLFERTHEALHQRIELRDAVCAYLEAERSQGVSLAVILQSVERILELAEARAAGGDASNGHRELAQQLIDWCIGPDEPPGLKIVS